jgi:Coenzyme PQQ synthesis protein D (PqqD)
VNLALSLGSQVVAAPGQLSSELSGEVVVLSLTDGVYYGLDAVGAQIWRLLGQPSVVDDLVTDVVARYHVDRDTCAHDVIAFLESLRTHGLIAMVHEGAS